LFQQKKIVIALLTLIVFKGLDESEKAQTFFGDCLGMEAE
jgi:uncharacterized lipoprotein YehR (DUF1307 family)